MAVVAGAAQAQLVHAEADRSPEDGSRSRLLVMVAVDKSFGTTKAVQQVDFAVHAAEIVGLMGGNGAGKSTLVKIVGGLVAADSGDIELLGRRVGADHSPRAAMQLGLRFVHQELSLCPNLRVVENFAVELPDVIRGVRWHASGCEFAKAGLDAVFLFGRDCMSGTGRQAAVSLAARGPSQPVVRSKPRIPVPGDFAGNPNFKRPVARRGDDVEGTDSRWFAR